jgi:hypothetical protein
LVGLGELVGPEEGASVGPEEGATVGPDEGMSAGSSDPSRAGPKDGIAVASKKGKLRHSGPTMDGLNELVCSRAELKLRAPKMVSQKEARRRWARWCNFLKQLGLDLARLTRKALHTPPKFV